mgnify:CR=1 FL=1
MVKSYQMEMKNIVVGLGFPGLEENLNLESKDIDIDIPDNFTITADVEKCLCRTNYDGGFFPMY